METHGKWGTTVIVLPHDLDKVHGEFSGRLEAAALLDLLH